MWLKKLQTSSNKNKNRMVFFVGLLLGSVTLAYPFALYFFHPKIPPLFFIIILGGVLLFRALLTFIIAPKKHRSLLEKNTLILSLFVSFSLGILFLLKGEIAALYYPVLMSLGMASVFAASLIFPPTIIERFARFQTPNLPPSGVHYTRQVTKIWVGFGLVNAALAYGTILTHNLEIWTLYNGLISYLLMGVLLAGEFLFRGFYKKKKHRQAFKNFTSLEDLLHRDSSDWEAYWNNRLGNYTGEINDLTQQIITSKVKRVFLISDDRALFLKGFLALLKSNKIIVLPHTNTPDFLKSLLQKDDLILSDQENLKTLSSHFINLKKTETIKKSSPVSLNSNIQIIFYTSGSTGTPKAIYKNLSQLENEVQELQKTWPLENNSTVYSMVPHHYLYGFLFSFLWPICAHIPLHRKTLQHWEELSKSVTNRDILISSPAHIGRFPQGFYAPLKYLFSSGGPLSFKAAKTSQKILGVLPIEVYGSTETGGIAYRQQLSKETLWTPFPAVDIRVDQDSKLSVKSPYLATPDFYQTADLVTLINKAQFTLQGRGDRIVKVEGKRICLIELEKNLEALKEIQEAHALLLNNGKRQEIGAIIVLTPFGQHQLKALEKVKFTRLLRGPLQSYFDLVTLPRRWRFVEEIPRNAQGKRPPSLLKTLFEKRTSGTILE